MCACSCTHILNSLKATCMCVYIYTRSNVCTIVACLFAFRRAPFLALALLALVCTCAYLSACRRAHKHCPHTYSHAQMHTLTQTLRLISTQGSRHRLSGGRIRRRRRRTQASSKTQGGRKCARHPARHPKGLCRPQLVAGSLTCMRPHFTYYILYIPH